MAFLKKVLTSLNSSSCVLLRWNKKWGPSFSFCSHWSRKRTAQRSWISRRTCRLCCINWREWPKLWLRRPTLRWAEVTQNKTSGAGEEMQNKRLTLLAEIKAGRKYYTAAVMYLNTCKTTNTVVRWLWGSYSWIRSYIQCKYTNIVRYYLELQESLRLTVTPARLQAEERPLKMLVSPCAVSVTCLCQPQS